MVDSNTHYKVGGVSTNAVVKIPTSNYHFDVKVHITLSRRRTFLTINKQTRDGQLLILTQSYHTCATVHYLVIVDCISFHTMAGPQSSIETIGYKRALDIKTFFLNFISHKLKYQTFREQTQKNSVKRLKNDSVQSIEENAFDTF